jgi:hypothetical protein
VPLFDIAAGHAPGAAVNSSPLFRLPLIPPMVVIAAAPALGIARSGIEDFRERHAARGTEPPAATPAALGLAEVEVEAAAALLARDARALGEGQQRAGPMSRAERARYRVDAAHVVATCARAVDRLVEASGMTGLAETSPLQRAAHDLRALAAYRLLRLDAATDLAGRIALGLRAGSTLL